MTASGSTIASLIPLVKEYPEWIAILLGWWFGTGTFYFFHKFGKAGVHAKPWVAPTHLALCVFLWTAFMWARIDPDKDITRPIMWGIVFGTAISAPFANSAVLWVAQRKWRSDGR